MTNQLSINKMIPQFEKCKDAPLGENINYVIKKNLEFVP